MKIGDIIITFLWDNNKLIPIKCKITDIKQYKDTTFYYIVSVEQTSLTSQTTAEHILESESFALFDKDGLIDKKYQQALENYKR